MNKRELALLEKAFEAEVAHGVGECFTHIMQTKSKLAEKLCEEGLLAKSSVKLDGWPPVTISGYELTHLGRMSYCMTCEE